MQNSLSDLNNHLFAQLERLNDEDLNEEKLRQEIERSKAITSVAKNIVDNARTTLDVIKYQTESRDGNNPMPSQLRIE